jgi:signal transduction histidine kinase
MTPTKTNRALAFLWVNLSVATVVLVLIATHQISSAQELFHVLVYALVYANLTGSLGVYLMSGHLERLVLHRSAPGPLVAACIIGISAVGCLLAQTLLMEVGFAVPKHFWAEYLHTLEVAIPLGGLFGLGALVHTSLRARVRVMEERVREKEVAEERAQKLAAQARLRSLESRIQPHFLFNTLNSISSLIAVDPGRAEEILGRLAALLRASLDTSDQALIPLRQELAMVDSYVEIARARFGDKLRGSVRVPVELQDAQVPPMSVQSLVENAVKHGITPKSGGGEFLVTASVEQGSLRVEVCDTGPGFDLAAVRAGHGLDSLVGRLDALYGAKACLNVFRRDEYSVVEMVLPRT